jgi:hypothetical protein
VGEGSFEAALQQRFKAFRSGDARVTIEIVPIGRARARRKAGLGGRAGIGADLLGEEVDGGGIDIGAGLQRRINATLRVIRGRATSPLSGSSCWRSGFCSTSVATKASSSTEDICRSRMAWSSCGVMTSDCVCLI